MKMMGKRSKKIDHAAGTPADLPIFLVGDVPIAYALVPSKTHGGNLWHLLKLEIKGDRVVRFNMDTEDLRGIKLAKLQDDAMSDL